MDKRYQFFISSTYSDLIQERDKVKQAVLELNHFPAGMEIFPAAGIPPKDLIENVIRSCDYYLLIIAGRYGSLTDDGISFTEWEYELAKKSGIPVIAFLHKDIDSIVSGKTDKNDELREKLLRFRNKVEGGNQTVTYWTNPDDLKASVLSSIPQAIQYQPRIGWARADTIATSEAQEEIKRLLNELSKLRASQNRPPQIEIITIPGTNVSFKMVQVYGGTFIMGTSELDEKPAHEVTLSDYWIGETPVTQAEWQAVMGNNPSNFKANPNLPVETVSWDDCQEFIARLNEKTGKQFHLPTEVQWEFAARGGNIGKNNQFRYAGTDDIYEVFCREVYPKEVKTMPVRKGIPNELGLYDMSGNVWEWCNDWYGSYSGYAQMNPTGPKFGENRVLRGGSYLETLESCRVAHRYSFLPGIASYDFGFRLAL